MKVMSTNDANQEQIGCVKEPHEYCSMIQDTRPQSSSYDRPGHESVPSLHALPVYYLQTSHNFIFPSYAAYHPIRQYE